MNFNEYQKLARSTAVYPEEHKVVYPALGLCGEAGEVAEKIKKTIRGDTALTPLDKITGSIADELGDVLWYLAILADDLGVELEDVAKWNVDKLQRRMKSNKIKGDGDNR